MQTTLKTFLSFFFCFTLLLLIGCGGVAGLSKAEREKADRILAENGRNAIRAYIQDPGGNPDVDTMIRYINYFVSKGADVNVDDGSPLTWAAMEGDIELVKFLISRGANVNVRVNYGSPLLQAVLNGNLELAEFLVSRGATVTDCLLWASVQRHGGDIEIIKFLVSKGANVGDEIDSILERILSDGYWNPEVFKFFISKGTSIDNIDGLLFSVIEWGDIEIVKFLVSKGANVNARNDWQWTPLYAAARRGNLEIVRFLVSQGADVNATVAIRTGGGGPWGGGGTPQQIRETPLDVARREGHTAIVNYLSSIR